MKNNKPNPLTLVTLAGAQFMVVLDATIVNVALPSIQQALNFTSSAQLQWIVTAYTLLFGGFLLLGGRLADLMGRRKIFLIGVTLFALSSLFAGLAQDPTQLIIFRSLQGLSGALLSPAALSLVLTIFKDGKERNRALGVWSTVAAGGGAFGLLLGGVLTQYIDWRWIFFINIPIAALIIFSSFRNLPKSLPRVKGGSLDVPGAVSVTAGLIILVYAFVRAADLGWQSAETIGFFVLSFILLVCFIINELKVKQPLMPMRIFKNRSVAAGNLMQLPVAAGMFGAFFYLSIYMQQVLHFTPFQSGLLNLPFTICIAITAGIISKNIAKVAPKRILVISPLFIAAGLFYFSRIPVDGNYVRDLLPGIILMGTGMGATFVALTLAVTSGVAEKESGLVSGLLTTAQQIGGAIGLAVLTTVSTSTTNAAMTVANGDQALLTTSLVSGFQNAFIVAGCFALSASAIAFIGLTDSKLVKHGDKEVVAK